MKELKGSSETKETENFKLLKDLLDKFMIELHKKIEQISKND